MRIYVGNLLYGTSEQALREAFEQFGAVDSATVITDRDTGRSRGFGFVEMSNDEARNTIEALNGTELDGRSLTVNEARPQERRSGTGGGGRFGGGGRGGAGRFGGAGGSRGGRW